MSCDRLWCFRATAQRHFAPAALRIQTVTELSGECHAPSLTPALIGRLIRPREQKLSSEARGVI